MRSDEMDRISMRLHMSVQEIAFGQFLVIVSDDACHDSALVKCSPTGESAERVTCAEKSMYL